MQVICCLFGRATLELRYWKIEDFIPPDSYRDHNSYCVIKSSKTFANGIREAFLEEIRYFVTLVVDIRQRHSRSIPRRDSLLRNILALIEQIILSQIPAFLQLQILQQWRFNIQLNVITLTQSEWNNVRT